MGLPPTTEQELIERARRGDVDAFGRLVREHQEIAFRAAYVITSNAEEAEEAAQDAFVKAYRGLPRFRLGEPLRPWLLTIVANEARNRRRAAGRRSALVRHVAAHHSLMGSGTAPGSDTIVVSAERHGALLSALETLRDDDRNIIVCRHLLGLSERESAAVLRCRPGTVKSRLSRALARLRAELGEELVGDE